MKRGDHGALSGSNATSRRQAAPGSRHCTAARLSLRVTTRRNSSAASNSQPKALIGAATSSARPVRVLTRCRLKKSTLVRLTSSGLTTQTSSPCGRLSVGSSCARHGSSGTPSSRCLAQANPVSTSWRKPLPSALTANSPGPASMRLGPVKGGRVSNTRRPLLTQRKSPTSTSLKLATTVGFMSPSARTANRALPVSWLRSRNTTCRPSGDSRASPSIGSAKNSLASGSRRSACGWAGVLVSKQPLTMATSNAFGARHRVPPHQNAVANQRSEAL